MIKTLSPLFLSKTNPVSDIFVVGLRYKPTHTRTKIWPTIVSFSILCPTVINAWQ